MKEKETAYCECENEVSSGVSSAVMEASEVLSVRFLRSFNN